MTFRRERQLSGVAAYRVKGSREGLQITVDEEHFWDDTIVRNDGTTQLDLNIASLVQEVRIACYYIATDGIKH